MIPSLYMYTKGYLFELDSNIIKMNDKYSSLLIDKNINIPIKKILIFFLNLILLYIKSFETNNSSLCE
jgi:hypothetical protein